MRVSVECIPGSHDETIRICCDASGLPAGCMLGTSGVDCCADGDPCTYLPTQCTYAGLIGSTLDVDTNGNGVPDALSAGFRFSWTGARIDGVSFGIRPSAPAISPRRALSFTASGGSGPYTWSLATNGSGGSIDAASGGYQAGIIGSTSDILEVIDGCGQTATATVTVTVGTGP